jgi:hypothetical protein
VGGVERKLKIIFENKQDEGQIKLHNEDNHNLSPSPILPGRSNEAL